MKIKTNASTGIGDMNNDNLTQSQGHSCGGSVQTNPIFPYTVTSSR